MNIKAETKYISKSMDSPVKASANVTLDDCFVIHNVKIKDVGNGIFVDMPSYRGRDGKWRNVCHPINNECRKEIQDAVMEAYLEK